MTPHETALGRLSALLWRRNPLTLLAARAVRWWQARLPRSDTLVLTQRNVYILPTRAGWMLGLTLLVLLIASINYQLNLGYLLTFLLAGAAVVGIHVCHNTLTGLSLHLSPPEAAFCGTSAVVEVRLSHTGRHARRSIGVAFDGSPHWSHTDVEAQSSSTVSIGFAAPKRGLHALPLITTETRFPLGTFRVWSVWRPLSGVLIYPQPEAHPPALPPGEPAPRGAGVARANASGDFDGVRAYRRGDALKLVVWKKAAKSDQLVSRNSEQAQASELWLDVTNAGSGPLEAKLSRLTAWVLAADRAGANYGLRLASKTLAPASGEAHRRACLEALALC